MRRAVIARSLRCLRRLIMIGFADTTRSGNRSTAFAVRFASTETNEESLRRCAERGSCLPADCLHNHLQCVDLIRIVTKEEGIDPAPVEKNYPRGTRARAIFVDVTGTLPVFVPSVDLLIQAADLLLGFSSRNAISPFLCFA